MSQLDAVRTALNVNSQTVADNTAATLAATAALAGTTPVDPHEVDALVATINANSTQIASNTAALNSALPKPPAA